MNKSKTKKLALVTTVAILILCLVPAVQGVKTSNNSINIRPIEDWLNAGNPFGSSPGYLDPDSMLAQRCIATVFDERVEYEGYIVEKLMDDKSLHITVKIKVEGMPMAIRDFMAIGTPEEWIFVGVMDFRYTAVFILEEFIPGGPLLDNIYDADDNMVFVDDDGEPPTLRPLIVPAYGFIPEGLPLRLPDADLMPWWMLYFYQYEVGGHFEKSEFKSKGSGNYIASGWSPFDDPSSDPVLLPVEANVKCHQVAIYGYNLPLSNPNVYQGTVWTTPDGVFSPGGPLEQSPLLMPEMWPVEYVTFY